MGHGKNSATTAIAASPRRNRLLPSKTNEIDSLHHFFLRFLAFDIHEGVRMVRSVSSLVMFAVAMVLVSVDAHAQAAAGPAAPAWVQMVPLIAMVAIFYFLILRPQQKREKTRQGFISQLKRGDEVITSTGMFGRVEGLTDQFVTLEISDGVRVKMLRSAISSSVQALTQASAAAAAKEEKGGKA